MKTIRELAEVLGLSKSAVAYALRGSPMVSAKTCDWVRTRARELGYAPNPVASAFLHQVRTGEREAYRGNLAFLTPLNLERPYLTGLQKGALERARELGYGLDIVPVGREPSARLTRLLLARGILGVIAGPLSRDMGHMSLTWARFAVVTYGYSMVRPSVHRVVHHHYQGVQAAFRTCKRKGYRRIGLMLRNESDLRSNGQWSSGFLGAQRLLPSSEQVSPLVLPGRQCTTERMRRWLRREKPQVVILHDSETREGLMKAWEGRPEDLPCVVLDRKPDDFLPGIDQQFGSCGRLLIDSLSMQIYHNERGVPPMPIVSIVNGIWIDQPSLPKMELPDGFNVRRAESRRR